MQDTSKLTPIADLLNSSSAEARELAEMLGKSKRFLETFDWCAQVRDVYLGIGIPGILVVALVRIEPAMPEADEWLWLIGGDLPPAYIATVDAPNPASALDAYLGELEHWINSVRAGESTDDCIPINVPPTGEFTDMLESRVRFIDEKILPDYSEDLRA